MGLPTARLPVSPEEYLAFERSAEEKHEYADGEIFALLHLFTTARHSPTRHPFIRSPTRHSHPLTGAGAPSSAQVLPRLLALSREGAHTWISRLLASSKSVSTVQLQR